MATKFYVPRSMRGAFANGSMDTCSVIALTSLDGSLVAISKVVPTKDANQKEVALRMVEQGVFIYPLESLSYIVYSPTDKKALAHSFVVSSLNGFAKVLTNASISSEVELVEEDGVAEQVLITDAAGRDASFWIRGAPACLVGGVQPTGVQGHIAVTHIRSSTVSGGLLDKITPVLTTAAQRQATLAGSWLIDVGSIGTVTSTSSDNETIMAGAANVRAAVFHSSKVSPSQLVSSIEPHLNGSSPTYIPTATRYIIPADGIHLCVPVIVCSDSDVARKTLHRELGLPLDKGLLRKREGVSALEAVVSQSITLTQLFPLKSGATSSPAANPEASSSLEEVAPNNGEPQNIKRLVAFPIEGSKKNSAAINILDLVKPKVVAKGVSNVVKCPVDYYHYRIDGFNDDGWGCAYRSLQLILSWFQRMGYTDSDTKTPSLPEIQKILSAVDPDKASKPKFVGSKEWIGSFEVMMVLQHFVSGLDCTIQRMESAKELDSNPTILRMLQTHFEKGGAPIMIGGSNYAHTILGVDINVRTMDAQFLIADPHYPSTTPDCHTIVSKGWVGWKDASKFFDAKSWYNMCIPRSYELDAS